MAQDAANTGGAPGDEAMKDSPMKKSRAKRNARRPPPGWDVYPQWIAHGPIATPGGVIDGCAGDGELFERREDAVLAAWDEYEETL